MVFELLQTTLNSNSSMSTLQTLRDFLPSRESYYSWKIPFSSVSQLKTIANPGMINKVVISFTLCQKTEYNCSQFMRDLDKLNMLKLGFSGYVLGSSKFLPLPKLHEKNDARFKSG